MKNLAPTLLLLSLLVASDASAKDETWTLDLPGPLEDAQLSPKATRLATVCKGTLKLWDVDAKRAIKEWEIGSQPVYALCESALLVAKRKTVMAVRITDGTSITTLDHDAAVEAIAIDAKGKVVLTGCEETITVYELGKGLKKKTSFAWKDAGPIRGIGIGPRGRTAIVTSDKKGAVVLDLKKGFGRELKSSIRPCNDRWVQLAAKGKLAISARGPQDPVVNVWDLEGERVSLHKIHHSQQTPLWYLYALAVDSKGERFYTASGDGKVYAWDLQKGQPLGHKQLHPKSVRHVSLVKDRILFAIGEDNVVHELRLGKDGVPK